MGKSLLKGILGAVAVVATGGGALAAFGIGAAVGGLSQYQEGYAKNNNCELQD